MRIVDGLAILLYAAFQYLSIVPTEDVPAAIEDGLKAWIKANAVWLALFQTGLQVWVVFAVVDLFK